jgi:hypothetical protein
MKNTKIVSAVPSAGTDEPVDTARARRADRGATGAIEPSQSRTVSMRKGPMLKRFIVSFAIAMIAMTALVSADQDPTFKGPLSPAEQAFVASIQADLGQRFPTAADAEKAAYVRYTSVDDTGAISYANLHWTSADTKHPSQLWYDKNGMLLGADFSVPYTTGKRPDLFGVNPGRWYEFDDHVHYVVKNPTTGKMTYDGYVMAAAWVKAGGSLTNPSAATLVKMGRVKSASEVTTIFRFPEVWDLIVWVKPNPNGAFADKNPLVKP